MNAETLPLLRALSNRRPMGRRLVIGCLSGKIVGVATVGVGPQKARARTQAILQRWPDPQTVISIGTCGALVDTLCVGDVVTADRLLRESGQCTPVTPLPGFPAKGVVTVSAPVWDSRQRTLWAQRGAEICEMEAAAIQDAAGDRTLQVLKVVSDLAGADNNSPQLRPGKMEIVRFKALALKLSEQRLLPALIRVLRPQEIHSPGTRPP